MKYLDKIFPFLDFLHDLRAIERKQYAVHSDRMENDAEHSYQLTMLAWFVMDLLNLDLDRELVLKYALSHDLVEVYAGDTPFWDAQKNGDNNKKEREEKALGIIEEKFGETFPDLNNTVNKYEKGKGNNPEANFVHALDKLIPMLNNYQDGGRSWKELNPELKLAKVIELKREKIRHSPEVEGIFNELVAVLERRKEEFFVDP